MPESPRRNLFALTALVWLIMGVRESAHAQEAARIHIAAFGLWGEEAIFRREATGAAKAAEVYFAAKGQIVVRSNTKTVAEAGLTDIREQLKLVADVANRTDDILFLFLTSHGTPEGVGVVTPSEKRAELLSPRRLGRILKAAGFKHAILVVSACYSGVFADALANDTTLVITAADAYRPSFGCGADVQDDWTYFGRAFFVDGLMAGRPLDEAFRIAKARVTEREKAEKFDNSNPQMRGGKAVKARLATLLASTAN